MTPKLVIFDWDGTLMDSQGKIVSCMQIAAEQCELPIPSTEQIAHIIGISLLPAIKQLFNLSDSEADEAQAIAIRDAYKEAYLVQDTSPCPLFSGVKDMLDDLNSKGLAMAVATGKARRGLQRAWDNTDTKAYFIASRTADEAESKPSSDMLIQLLEELKLQASEAIMVGDTSYDMQMARQINMPAIAVSYGVHDEQSLREQAPLCVVHSVSELHHQLITHLAG